MRPRTAPLWPALRALALGLGLASLGCVQLPRVGFRKVPAPAEAGAPAPAGDSGREQLLAGHLAACGLDPGRMAALEGATTGLTPIPGNQVDLLFDGPQTLGAMTAAISAAKDSINLETYIFDPDALGTAFADLLIRKQREGVRVNVLYDCVGTLGTPEAFFTRMREAGIHLCPFHPVNPLARLGRWRINHRDHRKILVVDGTIGFTGGANISGTYGHGSLFHRKSKKPTTLGWRDTHLRIEGPAVAALQLLFLETWYGQSPEELEARAYFPPIPAAGGTTVRVLGSQPGSNFEIYRAYVEAFDHATRSIHLTAAYFVPDPQTIDALSAAARRGVEVQLVLTHVTDSSLVHHASQSYYRDLLRAGIRVYQLNSSVLHAKTAVIDGRWSTVGSTNMDMRSFLFNKEVNVVVLGEAFGLQMETAFREDLKNSTEVTEKAWAQRPESDHLKEWAARILGYWL